MKHCLIILNFIRWINLLNAQNACICTNDSKCIRALICTVCVYVGYFVFEDILFERKNKFNFKNKQSVYLMKEIFLSLMCFLI